MALIQSAAAGKPIITVTGDFTVMIRGLAVAGVPRAEWIKALNVMGEAVQQKIADAFSKQRTASSPLRFNKPEYTAQKAKDGYDTRRGHRTNTLQSMLRPVASKLFVVYGPFKGGTARIVFREALLHGVVPYAEYYEAAKVVGGHILKVAKVWAQAVRAPIDAIQSIALQNIGATAAGGRLKILADRAEAAIALKRAASFAGLPARIRPTQGLTQRFTRGIAQEAQRMGLNRSQLAALDRKIESASRKIGR